MNDKELNEMIARINELAKKRKNNTLTEQEEIERSELKEKYRLVFRKAFEQQLLTTRIVDEQGNDVTPEKLKQAQCKIKKK